MAFLHSIDWCQSYQVTISSFTLPNVWILGLRQLTQLSMASLNLAVSGHHGLKLISLDPK